MRPLLRALWRSDKTPRTEKLLLAISLLHCPDPEEPLRRVGCGVGEAQRIPHRHIGPLRRPLSRVEIIFVIHGVALASARAPGQFEVVAMAQAAGEARSP